MIICRQTDVSRLSSNQLQTMIFMQKMTSFAFIFILIHIITTISLEETPNNPSTLNLLPLQHSYRHKIKTGENIYFSKLMKTGKSYKVQVNSPNVMVYASEKSKCQVPNQKCRERTGNINHSFIYEPQKDGELRINVEGLDNTEFELTIIENDNKVQLTDAVPFSYNMDTDEQRIEFTFTLKEKSDISFNLIAPLGAVTLIVSYPSPNGENEVQKSSDGYIQIAKQSLTKLNFTLKVQKTRTAEKYASHFILVASSSKSHLRLDPTVTHYETLSQDKSHEYILQFSFKQQHVLSFSFYNLNKEIDFQLLYSLNNEWDKTKSIKIDKEVQFVELNDKVKQLCEQQSESCEIFIKVVNHMSIQVDFTITLLVKDAILQLKDGIWQSFPANEVMTSSSFYFYPKYSHKNLLLFYHSTLSNLRVVYKLWKYDRENINPSKWPFPFVVQPSQKTQAEFKKSNFISIDKEQIQKICWPNCVLLINFYLETDPTLPYNYYQSSQFKIMASNSQIQLPQKHKTTFTLGKQEDKQILIDLKYPLTKEAITFYTAQTIGQCTLSANVYSQKNQKCPIIDESPDFAISWGEYSIKTEALNKVLKSKEMQDDKNLYLCVVVHSEDSCKLSIEYTAQDDIFKEIYVDSFEDIKLDNNQTKYFQMDGAVEHYSKITRIKGFPFVYMKNCKDKGELDNCKEEFTSSQEKGKQIIVKTQSLDQQACQTCTLLIKFSSIQPSEISFHSQSKYSEMELKEKVTVSDFLNQRQISKYQIFSNKEEDLIINIHIQEGNIEAKLTDGAQINLLKKSTQSQRILQFIIKGNQDQKKQSDTKQGMMNPLAFSKSFTLYHLVISSTNQEKASSYSIAYSSGKRQFFLQDGLIVDYQLQSNKPHSFYYCNEAVKQHIFYTVSTSSSNFLKKLKIQAFSFTDFQEGTQRAVLQISKPKDLNKKTPNPTLVYELKSQNCIEIKLTNPTARTQSVSMGVNHQEVVFLPFNHDYPFILHQKEYLNVLTDVNIPGFIDLELRKCDQTTPTLSYTFDYDGFIKGEYLYEAVLTQQSSFKYHIKANRIGTLYIKIEAAQQQTTANIKMVYNEQKPKQILARAGKHGIMQYNLVDSQTANISFAPVECGDCKNIKYMAVSSQSEQNLYQQMVCPNTYFAVTKLANKVNIPNKGQKEEISFMLSMETGVQYVGVMAVTATGEEIFYKPIEVGSLWNKWEQNSTGHRFMMVLIILLTFCVLAIWIRRLSRKGYKPLNEGTD